MYDTTMSSMSLLRIVQLRNYELNLADMQLKFRKH